MNDNLNPGDYLYVRALEWEGTWPKDVGSWGRTISRILVAEGTPTATDFALGEKVDEDLPPAPRYPRGRLKTVGGFIAITSTSEAVSIVDSTEQPVSVSIELTDSWADPSGEIQRPFEGQRVFDQTHAVSLDGYDALLDRFRFHNWWANWGDAEQRGWMPSAYLDAYAFEGSAIFSPSQLQLLTTQTSSLKGMQEEVFVFDIPHFPRVFLFEIRNEQSDKVAWCYVKDLGGRMLIYELFVLPSFRRQGHASRLVDMIRGYALGAKLAISVPYSDSKESAPETFPAIARIAAQLGIQFETPQSRYDCYFGIQGAKGSESPVHNNFAPTRPKVALCDVQSFAVESRLIDSTSEPPVRSNLEQLNRRRFELIQKKNRAGLTRDEFQEFTSLQLEVFDRIRRSSPDLPSPQLDEIQRLLEEKAGSDDETKREGEQ
ncbi:GNAT family protein [Neorhodopirellula pilleata]|uniref:N-acetyltransferase domain-containing protein n=1 Tax=Neorhodopirellula pilleata TaxID=2714738 RepID=A0A5C6A9N8_9BACT|nr:hypothetical protein [Neorhodopirellula pilleata]TWT95761.1 hypothetical protein Pla100_34030 [Neorhodopirellula pilleata]